MSKATAKLKEQARVHEQNEEWAEAIKAYKQVLRIAEEGEGEVELSLLNRIGDLFLRLRKGRDAIRYYELAADRYEAAGLYNNAIALCNKAIRQDSTRAEPYYRLARLTLAQGFLNEAQRWAVEYAERMIQAGKRSEALAALNEFATHADPELRELLAQYLRTHGVSAELAGAEENDAGVTGTKVAAAEPSGTGGGGAGGMAGGATRPGDPSLEGGAPDHRAGAATELPELVLQTAADSAGIDLAGPEHPRADDIGLELTPVTATTPPAPGVVTPLPGLEHAAPTGLEHDDLAGLGHAARPSQGHGAYPGLGHSEPQDLKHSERPGLQRNAGAVTRDTRSEGPAIGDDILAAAALFDPNSPGPEPIAAGDLEVGGRETGELDIGELAVGGLDVGELDAAGLDIAGLDAGGLEAAAEESVLPELDHPGPGWGERVEEPVAHGGFIDFGALLQEARAEPGLTRYTVDAPTPSGDEDHDFLEMLAQFKSKVSEHLGDEDAQSRYDLGLAFKEMGLYDEAISQFQIALRGLEDRLKVYEELGDCFIQKGEYTIALKILKGALGVALAGGGAELIGIHYQLGRSHEALGQIAEARDAYERVIAFDLEFRDTSARLARL